jgi:hypothetical protein
LSAAADSQFGQLPTAKMCGAYYVCSSTRETKSIRSLRAT